MHADLKVRESLALDPQEAVRSQVDSYVLQSLCSHSFAARDFFEARQGVHRVLRPVTHRLAETAPNWARAITPMADGIPRTLCCPEHRRARRDRTRRTLLTRANRSAGREELRRRPERRAAPCVAGLPSACRECGVVLDDPTRVYCDDCLPDYRSDSVAVFASAGPDALERLRAQGRDPAHGGEPGRKRGRRYAGHARAIAEWDRAAGGPKVEVDFARDVLPRLRTVPLRGMAEATGLSEGYCSFVRRGRKAPHPRHWDSLARIAQQYSDPSPLKAKR